MGCSTYLLLTGSRQGAISSGCGGVTSIGNKYQAGHLDEILVYEANYGIQMADNKALSPLVIRKPIDRSSPLLLQAVNDNEMLECELNFYRTNSMGFQENYYKIKLMRARIVDLHAVHPHSLTHNDMQPEEIVTFRFATITVSHLVANTSGWASWNGFGDE
jgi:type VI secretion system Hcp family effector